MDSIINTHGKQVLSLCELHKISPLNHCSYYNKNFSGKFTYHKAGKKSQTDFLFTNDIGRKHVDDFQILEHGWHLSDHLPLSLTVKLPAEISSDKLLLSAMELTETYWPLTHLQSWKFKFNYEPASEMLQEKYFDILGSCNEYSPDLIIDTIEKYLVPILKANKAETVQIMKSPTIPPDIHFECDRLYALYIEKLKKPPCTEHEMSKAYEEYQMARNRLTSTLLNLHEEEYKNIIENGDDKKLWAKINWSGRHNSNSQHIPIQIISNYFEQLHQPLDTNEKRKMENFQSNVYIPITDDPSTGNEIHDAYSDMKKGGYDFSLPVLKILVTGFLPILLLLLNLVF